MNTQPETCYAIVAGCNKCTPYYLVAGSTNTVVEHINKLVGDNFNLLEHLRDDDHEEDEVPRVYIVPKQYTEMFFHCSCFAEIYLYTVSGVANLQEMMNDVREQVV